MLTPAGKTSVTGAGPARGSRAPLGNLRDQERCPVRALKEMSAAPRGALPYSRFSREELGGTFLDLMPYLDPKGEGDQSMPGK